MTIEDLVTATGAPSADALKAEMTALSITAEELAASTIYQKSLKDEFTRASSLATTQTATPTTAKRGRKPAALKLTTAEKAAAVNKAGKEEMTTVASLTNENQIKEFKALAKDLAASADQTSDAIAGLVLAYPGLVNSMAAQKVTAGVVDAPPGFCWADESDWLSTQLKEVVEEYEAEIA